MKLGIFIPAYNEEQTIVEVLAAIPCEVMLFRQIKVFLVDDGSDDHTVEVARHAAMKLWLKKQPKEDMSKALLHFAQKGYVKKQDISNDGIEFEVLSIRPRGGLANAFKTGLGACLNWGADLIAHFDADGQYLPSELQKIIAPILANQADMVTGDRQIEKLAFMGSPRKYGNIIGSGFMRLICGISIHDASSGFRAYNRSAAMRLEVHNHHTYTHETLIEAHFKGIRMAEVPITFVRRGADGRSRLTHHLFTHIGKSLLGILKAWWRYR